ncbi:hypothetical protein HYD50_01105 [Mycoplasmopsis bovis]|nr:hypothetical protein [Mycoplasmopsis bovis]QQH72493.1 hypothetical protein HYD50_01105 [Mycoplasmopsis bovis]
MVLVIHLRILPHKLKIFKSKKIRIKEKEKDNPKDLLKQLDEIKPRIWKSKKDNEKLIEESNYFNDLKKWFGRVNIPKN